MHSIEEKRVYGDREGALEAYVASSIGVVRVRVAGDTVGEFGLCDRCTARDIAATDGTVAVATDENVSIARLEADADGAGTTDADDAAGTTDAADADDPTFVGTGFGPAVAVGYDGSELIAAGPDGDVARFHSSGAGDVADGTWESLEHNGVGTIRAIDGDLIGTDSGVYRVHDSGLDHAGLSDVRDVSAAGIPLAATANGLYKLGNGWMETLEGPFETVAADPRTEQGQLTRAAAVSGETVSVYDADEETWREYDRSSERLVGFGYGETIYAVTERGTFLSATPEDDARWRSRTLGVGDVTGLAVPSEDYSSH